MDTRKIFGFNFRITEMQGVVGKAQLKKLDKIIYENKKRYFALHIITGTFIFNSFAIATRLPPSIYPKS